VTTTTTPPASSTPRRAPARPTIDDAWRRLEDWLPGARVALPVVMGREVLDAEVVELVWPRHLTPPPSAADFAAGVYFDWQEVARFLAFARRLRHIKGRRWGGRPLELELWQVVFIAAPVFGWLNADGTRRTREVFLEVGRKNGKSTLCAAIALYLLTADGEPGAEVYSAAINGKQARAVFDVAAKMAKASPGLRRRLRVKDREGTITFDATSSTYSVLTKSAKGGDDKHGLNTHGAVVDELHVITDPGLLDTLETSTGSRSQPLIVFITTAGIPGESAPWEERRATVINTAARVVVRTDLLGIIFAADPTAREADRWTDPEVWRDANPLLPASPELRTYLEREVAKVKAAPGRLNRFLRLHLGIPTEASYQRITVAQWDRTAGLVDELELRGQRCYGGLDLSSSIDLCALVLVFPDEANNVIDVVARFWTPADTLTERAHRDRADYAEWARRGWLKAVPGETINYDVIELEVGKLLGPEGFDVKAINYDRWGSKQLRSHLEDAGAPIWEIGQGFASLSPPLKELERLVAERKIRHGGNPVLRFCASGMAVLEDPAGNIKPDRKRSTSRIDGMVALTMAIAAWLADETPGRSVYEDRGVAVSQ
jgi:phage terminase large subunit-like protein